MSNETPVQKPVPLALNIREGHTAKQTLAGLARESMHAIGLPSSYRMLLFPTGATVPAEVAAQADLDCLFRPSVSVGEKTSGRVNFVSPNAKALVMVGERTYSLRPGIISTNIELPTGDAVVSDLITTAQLEMAEREAKKLAAR